MSSAGPVSDGPLAVLAGAGALPRDVADEVRARGRDAVILKLDGIADADFGGYRVVPVKVHDPVGVIAALRAEAACGVVMAGAVHRPGAATIIAAWQALHSNSEIRRVIEGGDDNLLRGVVRYLEENGFPVYGLREVAPGLMAPHGCLAGTQPPDRLLADIEQGMAVLRQMGPADIGQACVVSSGRVLAVEAAEGTDAMIRRVRTLRRRGLIGRVLRSGRPPLADRRGGAVCKAAKPGQDERVDLPVVGPRTVRLAAAAGLSALAIEAGAVLIVERERTLAEAQAASLTIYGWQA